MDFEHILVASDLSNSARHCHRHAAAFARHFGARLTLLYADESGDVAVDQDTFAAARADALAQVRADFAALDVAVETRVGAGPAKQVIDDYARAHGVDLIVLGKRSRGAIGHWVMGATANRVLRLVDVPILVIPVENPQEAPELTLPTYANILAATDLGSTSLRGLGASVALAERLGAEVTAVTILNWAAVTPAFIGGAAVTVTEDQMAALRAAHHERMTEHVGALGDVGLKTRVVVAENTPSALVEVADAMGMDLIAIPTTGKGALRRIFLGSTAERVVKRAHVPVFVMPPACLERFAPAAG